MVNILFVDDDELILAGQRRMLRANRREWNMHMAPGGNDGLAILRREPIEVVVSDMRMPIMDGATFLHHVRHEFPDTVRIILSGQADEASTAQAVSAAHQFLSKPCDGEQLKSTIRRVSAARESIPCEELRAFVFKLASCPSDPETLDRISSGLRSDSLTLEQCGQLVQGDSALSLKIAQLVSTSFFGAAQKHVDPAFAMQLFSLHLAQSLFLSTDEFMRTPAVDSAGPDAALVRAAAKLAYRLAADDNDDYPEDVRLAVQIAFLGDSLLREFCAEREHVLAQPFGGDNRLEAEREAFGIDQFGLAATLADIWGLPERVTDLVRQLGAPAADSNRSPAHAVAHLAVAAHHPHLPLDRALLEQFNLTSELDRLNSPLVTAH